MFSGQQAWYFDYGNAQEDWQKTNKVSAPKLRASAGETRSLIPWSLEIAEALLDKSNTFENTIFQATLQLNACYSLLSRDLWNPQELAIAGQRFLLLYVSLSDSDPEGMFWRFKPKHHLFQELCEFDECCPSQNWTYRDEDMGGTVAAISRRRGGEPCLPFGVCLCFFPLASFYLVWCHMICRIWGKYNCFNFQKYIVQIHVSTRTSTVACCMKRKKEILVKQTLAHICFLFISLPMPGALAGTHYILVSSRIWKSPTQRKDFYTEERKPPQKMHSFCKGKIS